MMNEAYLAVKSARAGTTDKENARTVAKVEVILTIVVGILDRS